MDFAFNHGSQLIGSACNNLLHKLLQMQRPWERATVLCSSDAPAQAGLHTGILHHDSGAWHRRLTTTPLFGLRLLMHAVDWIAVTQSPWLMVFMASSVFQFQLLCSLSLDRANWNNWLIPAGVHSVLGIEFAPSCSFSLLICCPAWQSRAPR